MGAFALSARLLERGFDAARLAALGALAGVVAFAGIILAAPTGSTFLLQVGSGVIGFGGGLFLVGTLTTAMDLEASESGLAMGAWGGVHATAAGLAIALGGVVRDGVASLAAAGHLGPGLVGPEAGYMAVYHVEIAALFLAMAVLGPMVRAPVAEGTARPRFGLAELPG